MPQIAESVDERETGSKREQSFVTAVDAGDAFLGSQGDSVVALGAGATANRVFLSRLARRNGILERHGAPRVTTYPSQARFRFGGGLLREVRHAADRTMGMSTAYVLGGGMPALLRKGAV